MAGARGLLSCRWEQTKLRTPAFPSVGAASPVRSGFLNSEAQSRHPKGSSWRIWSKAQVALAAQAKAQHQGHLRVKADAGRDPSTESFVIRVGV